MNTNSKQIDCLRCQHYFVTWDKKFPKGCRLFGFKSSMPPSNTVFEATGSQCTNFIPKTKKQN